MADQINQVQPSGESGTGVAIAVIVAVLILIVLFFGLRGFGNRSGSPSTNVGPAADSNSDVQNPVNQNQTGTNNTP